VRSPSLSSSSSFSARALDLTRASRPSCSDDDIVKVLLEATDNVASAFKARGASLLFLFILLVELSCADAARPRPPAAIPEVMRAIDLLGMEAARKTWRCCSMNECVPLSLSPSSRETRH